MTKNKEKKKLMLVISAVGFLVLFSGSIFAVIQLQIVPQKIGLRDVPFDELNRPYCEECHEKSVADRHHKTKNAKSGNCVFCHQVVEKKKMSGVVAKRNCLECHKISPHHQTEEAVNNQCTDCHDSPGLDDYTAKVPEYKHTIITPTVEACRKCHRNGKVDGKNVYGPKKTHHAIKLKSGCTPCHEKENESKDIRFCEKCHTVKALHEVKPHVDKKNCIHCHDVKAGEAFAEKKEKK